MVMYASGNVLDLKEMNIYFDTGCKQNLPLGHYVTWSNLSAGHSSMYVVCDQRSNCFVEGIYLQKIFSGIQLSKL